MKVLLSAPRAGSSYFYEYIEAENLKLPNVKPAYKKSEFLNPDILPEKTLDQKIDWLEKERKNGTEYTFKHHINYLMLPKYDYYNNWFIDFYKNDDIIVLRRRDYWKWFLSFLFQDFHSWKTAGVMLNDNNFLKDIKNHWQEYDFNKSIHQFISIVKQLDKCKGHTVYYEDLTYESKKYKKLSSFVDYEKYFVNIDTIKSLFHNEMHKQKIK